MTDHHDERFARPVPPTSGQPASGGPLGWDEPDDDLARLLRTELQREAATINPGDRFAEVMAATEHTGPRRSPWRWVGVAAALLLVAGIIAPLLLSHHNAPAPSTRITRQVAQQPTSSTSLATQQLHLPVYYVNTENHMLYPESRDLPTLTSPLVTAVNAVLNVAPNNAQYGSLWKGGTVLSAAVRDGVAVVNLSGDSYNALPHDTTAMQAAYQMYWTVNAVLSNNEDPIPVVLEANGSRTVPVFGNTAASGFWASPPQRGPVYIDTPDSGSTVTHGQVTVKGFILAGTAAPKVTIAHADGSSPVACATTTQPDASRQWTPWTCTATLQKGEYQATVSAFDTTNRVLFTVS